MSSQKLIKFPKIGQYRNAVYNVNHKSQFVKMDDDGEAIINKHAEKPKLKYEGTAKLHGTNASVAVRCNDIWTQSRNSIITPQKDNAGFSSFIHPNKSFFRTAAQSIADVKNTDEKNIVFFGEWCGKGIQKSVAINELEKMFVIFGILLVGQNENSEDEDSQGSEEREFLTRKELEEVLKKDTALPDRIYTIYDFKTWKMEIDFENPANYQNELNNITDEVEAECPVGKAFDVSGTGEGVVWKCVTPGYENSGFWFKVKGKKHSKSKVKTLAKVDIDRLNNIKELAQQVANNERLEQMHQEVFNTLNGGETEIKNMGAFIKATMGDIFKEEIDLITANGYTGKDMSSPVAKICRDFIMDKLEVK